MEETISLRELFETLKKRLWLIALITVLAATTSAVVSFFVLTPIYQSSTQILVNQSKTDQAAAFNYSDIRTNVELINTYTVIMKSPTILEKVGDELGYNNNQTAALKNKIQVRSENNSQVMSVTVEDPDPVAAVDIANTVSSVFKREIVTIMNVDNVSILAKAEVSDNPTPVKPRPMLNIAIALVVGLMAGVGLAFLLEYLDNTIKTEQDIEKLLELPVLGAVTTIDHKSEEKASKTLTNARGLGGETIGS